MRPVGLVTCALIAGLVLTPAAGYADKTEWSGFVSADHRVNTASSADDTYGKARIEMGYASGNTVFLRASAELRYYDLPAQDRLPAVPELEAGAHSDMLLWEAYLAADAFLLPNLDVRIGKQRIAWGRADRFNPTDNLNPDDLTDPFDFGAKVPSWAALATMYVRDSSLTAVWVPHFEPALLARGGTVALLGVTPYDVALPSGSANGGTVAVKFSSLAFNVDYSLSYLKGPDDLPVPVPTAAGPVLRFPKRTVLGFDFAGEIGPVGVRGELARFAPEAVGTVPYTRYTLGLEYTFATGTFLEAQFVHGFNTERGAGNLGNFLLLTVKQSFLNDDLKLSITAGREERTSTARVLHGAGVFPELTYSVTDNLELSGGAYLVYGDDGTLFGRFRAARQVFIKSVYHF